MVASRPGGEARRSRAPRGRPAPPGPRGRGAPRAGLRREALGARLRRQASRSARRRLRGVGSARPLVAGLVGLARPLALGACPGVGLGVGHGVHENFVRRVELSLISWTRRQMMRNLGGAASVLGVPHLGSIQLLGASPSLARPQARMGVPGSSSQVYDLRDILQHDPRRSHVSPSCSVAPEIESRPERMRPPGRTGLPGLTHT